MATKYVLTITQISQKRKRGDTAAPPEESITMYQQAIEQRQIVDVIKLINDKPNVKVSEDGVRSEVVKP